MVNIQTLLEEQQRALTTADGARNFPSRNSTRSPTAFLHLMPRSNTAGGPGIVGVNSPKGAVGMKNTNLEMLPPADIRQPNEDVETNDDLLDMNMSLGLHVRSLPQIQGAGKQWSPEVARELRKGFNI